MTYYSGKGGYIGLAFQAVAGTPEVAADVFIGTEDWSDIETEAMNYYSKEFRGDAVTDAEINAVYRKPNLIASGSLGGPMYADAFTYMLLGICGTVTTSGDLEGFTNTYTFNNQALPVFTVFKGVAGLNIQKFHDMTMKSLTITGAPGENVAYSVDMSGAPGDIATAALTPTYQTRPALNGANAVFKIGGSADCDVDAFEITIDRGVQENKSFCSTGLGGWYNNFVYPTTTMIEGTFTKYFTTFDEYELFLGKDNATAETTSGYSVADADVALAIEITGTEEIKPAGTATMDKLTFNINKALYDTVSLSVGMDDRVKAEIAFKAMLDVSKTPDSVATIELISGVDGDSIS